MNIKHGLESVQALVNAIMPTGSDRDNVGGFLTGRLQSDLQLWLAHVGVALSIMRILVSQSGSLMWQPLVVLPWSFPELLSGMQLCELQATAQFILERDIACGENG